MTECTLEKVLGQLQYEFAYSDDAHAYRALASKSGVSDAFKKLGELITGIARGNITPTADQLHQLSTFPTQCPADLAALEGNFRKFVSPLLTEALLLHKAENTAAAPAAKVDLDQAYSYIEMDVLHVTRGSNMSTYGQISDAFPDEAALLNMLSQQPSKRNLTLKQVESLIALPGKIENHNDFQTPSPTRFLSDYKKITGPLKAIQSALKLEYPPEEKALGDALEIFFKLNGQKLHDVFDKHRGNSNSFRPGQGVDSLLQAGKKLNDTKFWGGYSLNRDELHNTLAAAAGLSRADSHPTYGPLVRGHSILEDAKVELSGSMSARTEFTALENMLGQFQNVRHKVGFAKEAVAKQIQQSQTP